MNGRGSGFECGILPVFESSQLNRTTSICVGGARTVCAARSPILQGISSGSMGSDDAASPSYPHAVDVVAEAFGEGRADGGAGVVGDTLACVLRASEPAAVVFGKALSGGGNTAYATGRSQGPTERYEET